MRKTMTHSLTKRAVWAALFALLLCLFAGAAVADTYGDLEYADNGDGTCTITGWSHSVANVEVPETINGLTVTTIGSYGLAEGDGKELETVKLPDTVTTIEDHAFYNATLLRSVELSASLTTIGDSAFVGTTLAEVVLPEGLVSIGAEAFYSTNITALGIPGSVVSIGAGAFKYCDKLISVDFPASESPVSIGEEAFANCTQLTSVSIGAQLETISASMFANCDLLASVQLPDGLVSISDKGFYYCPVLTKVTLPSSLTSIGEKAFYNCYELTGITLPEGLTDIGSYAFSGCRSLTGTLTIPSGMTVINNGVFSSCCYDTVYLPEGITSIGTFALSMAPLKNIDLPDSLVSLGDSAFASTGLETVYLPDGLTTLGDGVFKRCNKLTSVRLPQSLTTIGAEAFYECTALDSLRLPNNISSIGENAFYLMSGTYGDILIDLYCLADTTTYSTLRAAGLDYLDYSIIPVHEIATAADGTKEVTINGTVDAAAWASIKSECGDSAISALYIADGAVLTNPGSLSGIKVTNAGTIDGAFTLYNVVNEKTGVISGSYEKEDGDFYFDSSIQGEIENYGTITALSLGSATVKLNEGTIRVAATYNVWEWDEGYGWGTREKLVEYGKPVSEVMGVGGWYTYSGEFANDMIVGLSGNTYYQQWIITDGVMNVQPMGSNNTKPVQITSDMLTDVTQIVVEMGTIAVDSISIPVVLQNTKCDDGVYYTSALAGGTYNGDITVESAAEIGNSTINGNLILQSHCSVADTTTFGSNAQVTVTGSLGSISNNWKPNGYPYTYNMDLTIAEGGSVSVNSVFTGKVTNYGKISNGTYNGTVINYGTITGGTFNGTLKDYSAHEHAPGGSETSVSWTRWDGSSKLSLSSGDNYIALAGDVSYRYNIAVNTGVHLYLCLDGYDLTSSYAGDVITVSGGTLTLCDCAGNKGSITHAADVTGRGVLVNAGAFNMYGGCVANNLCLSDGAGVCASNSGVFTMYDGKITGNNDGTNNFIHGGGVMADYGGTFIMYGGEISGNTATHGGGVRVSNNGAVMQLHGGSITGNTASDLGGGVYMTGNCTFEMDGGAITGNTAGEGGGVFDNASTTTTPCFTMTGGSITNNTATVDAAGVDGAVKLGGSPVISGNKLTDGTASNLGSAGLINPLSGEFTGNVYVNPKLPAAGASTSFVQRTDGELTEADLACFHADNASYKLYLNEDGLGVLGFPTYQLTLTGAVFADGSSTKAIVPGTTVQIRAITPANKYFRSWTRADGRAIESTESLFTFTMPPMDVSISAVFVDEFEIVDGTLVSYNGNDKVVTLPETVTAVAEGAFDRATAMETLIIPVACNLQNKLDGIAPENVLRLFVSSGLLKAVENAGSDVVLPADIIAIYSNTFNGSEIVSISAPAVNAAGSLAFSGCPNLTTVDLPLLLTVSESLFYNTPSLSDVNLPRATAVESHAFYTSGISTLSLPNVVTIGDNAFSSSTISSISIPNVESIGNNAFANCQSLTTFSAPNLTSLDKEAFNFAGKLTTVSVPKLKDIPENAFKGCTKLTSFEHDVSAAHTIGDQAFLGAEFTTFDLTNVTSIGSLAFGSCDKLTSVIIPSSATVADDAFDATTMQLYVSDSGYLENVKNVQPDVTLPESITYISTEAFAGSEIVSISAPGVTKMCESGFYDCTSLTTVSLPKLETVPSSAFYGTTALASVDLTAAKVIESNAFDSSGITTLSLPAVETIETYAFYGSSITSISVPNVESIGLGAFGSCRKLTTFSAPNLTSLGKNAFSTDIGLTTISMPKLKDIPYSAFNICDALTSFEHDTSVAHTIGENSFALTALTDFDLTNVTSIGSRAFWAAKITTIVIPDSVTEIGAEAFPTDCIIRSSATAYARSWAQENGYPWEHDQHAPAVLAAVAATCTETGLTEGSWCPDCEAILLAQEVIPALGHTAVEDKAVDPTCTETGLTAGTHCSVCGEVLTAQEIVPANGHTEAVDAAVSPTCTETGLTEGKHCSVCLEVLVKQEPVPATGHTEAIIPGFAPTCTETGVKDYIFCEVCEEELQAADEIPALGHTDSITLEAIAPTCTEAGRTAEHRCSVCRVVLTASEPVAALGHTEYVSAEAVEATCQNDGLTAEISCSVCSAVLEPAQTVPALPHTTVIDEAVAPDCVNTGLTQGSHCGACGDVLEEQQTLPALGHTAVTDPAVAPTDYESGLTEGSHCGVCGETLVAQEVIPANFTWDGTTITAYNGTAENVVIPEGTTALGSTVFKNNTAIKTVTVPASVTALGTQTFYGCTALTDVYLPENVTTIGATTFFKVTARIHASAESATAIALSHRAVSFTTEDGLILRYRVTTAGGTPSAVWAMGYCGGQAVVDLPETVNGVPLTQIGEYAFANQPQLMDVHIPDTVTIIGDYAFDGWAGSGAIFLPDEITSVGANTFPYQLCPHCRMNTTTARTLRAAGYGYGIIEDFDYIENADGTVTITGYVHDDPEMVITEDVGAMTVTAIGADAFSESSFITSAVLPDTVASIGDRAFASCSQLAAITLPDNITFIGEQVFHANTAISCKADSVTAATLDAAGYVYTAIPSYTYTDNGDGTATITGYTGSRTALVIPAEIDGLTVTAIGEYAFHNQQTLTSVVLPETVTSLEQDAFNGCSALAQITLPDGLTFLGANAFNGCSALSEIEIPAGVLFIGEEAFRNCSNLVSIDLPNGVTELYYNTFDGCTSLQSVTLPSGLTLLDSAVFQNCTSLQSIFLPASLTSISSSAFNHCDSLTATVIDGSYAHTWCVENGVAVNVTADAYAYTDNGDGTCTITGYYGADSQVKIPSTLDGLTVTALAEGMFAGDTRIQRIDLPETITDIPAYLCDGCTQLEELNVPWPVQLNSIGSYAFRNCTSLYISDSAVHIGEGAYQGCTALHSASLGGTVSIGAYAFDGCTSIEDLYASYALREIGDYAFRNCSALSSLTHMDLGAEITAIGSGAFEGCTSMQNLLLPNRISAVGEDAFDANTAVQCVAGTQTEETLKAAGYAYEALGRFSYTDNGDGTCTITRCNTGEAEVVIPSELDGLKVTAIGNWAFSNRHSYSNPSNVCLTRVVIPEGVTSIGLSAFCMCTRLTSIDLPDTLISIGENAFSDCSFTSLDFPDNIESIGDYAFSCSIDQLLTAVDLPANLKYFGVGMFSSRAGLCTLTISSTNAYYQAIDNVLYTKDGKTLVCHPGGLTASSFTVPEGVTAIADSAFSWDGPGHLKNLVLPSTLETIGNYAFNLYGIEELIIPYGVHTIGDNAFSSCPCMTSIVIPKTVTSIGDNCMPLYVMGPVGYVTATVIENSYAHTWCVENDIAVNVLEDVAASYPYTDNGDGTATITGYTGTQTDVVIPATIDGLKVTAIGANAFRDNDSIASVVIPEGVTVIGTNAFWECSALQSVSLPSTLETIRDYAFSWCSSLNELTIPAATTEIGWSFFGQPTMITVDSANTAYTAIDGVLYSADLKTLKFCPDVKTGVFMIPEGTEVIDGRAFFGCDQLTELHIPASVTDVSLATGSGAFASMDALERFVVDENNSLLKTVNGALLTKDGKHLINVPMTFSGAYTVPEGVEIIRYHAFGGGITDVTLPNGVTGIGNEAFFRLPLHSINLPASITFISDYAFTDCGDFTATVRGGSYAHTWCLEHDVAVNVVYTPATEMTAIPLSRINTSGANGVVGQNLSVDGAYHILVDDEATDWNEVVTLHDQIINWGFGVSAPAGAVSNVSITGAWSSDEEIIERLKLDAEYQLREDTFTFNSLELAEYVKSAGLVSLRNAGEPEDSDMPFVHAIMWFAQDGTPICIEKMTLRLEHTTSTLYPAAPYQLDPSLVTPNAENLPGVTVDFADGVLTYTVSEEMLSSGTSYVTTQITVPEGAVGYKAGYYDDGIQSVEPGATLAHTHSCLDYSDWVSLFTGVRTEKIVLLWVDENGECLKDGGQLEVRLVSSNSGERKPWPAYASDERWQPVPADRLSISFNPDNSLLHPVHWNSVVDFLPGSVSGTGDLRWAETRYTVKAPEGAVAVRTNESGGSNFWNTYADSDYFNGFIGQSTLYPLTTDSYEVGNGIFAQLGAPHAKLELYQTHTSDPDWGGVHHLYWYDSLTATEPMLVDWIAYQQPAALLAYQTEPCLTESELGAAVIAPMFVDETGSSCALTSIEWLDRDEYAYEMYLTSPGGETISPNGQDFYLPYPDGHDANSGYAYTVYTDHGRFRGYPTAYGIRFRATALGYVSLSWTEAQPVEPMSVNLLSFAEATPTGLVFETELSDGRMHIVYDDVATDWNSVVSYGEVLDGYVQQMVYLGWSDVRSADAFRITTGNWATDDELLAALAKCEVQTEYYLPLEERTFPIASYDAVTQTITPVSISKTIAVQWLDKNGNILCTEKVDVSSEHTSTGSFPAVMNPIDLTDAVFNAGNVEGVTWRIEENTIIYTIPEGLDATIETQVKAPEGTAFFRPSITINEYRIPLQADGMAHFHIPADPETDYSCAIAWLTEDDRVLGGGRIHIRMEIGQPAQILPIPMDRIDLDDVPFGMAMENHSTDGSVSVTIDDEATDWNKVLTFNDPLHLFDPETGDDWYANEAVNFGFHITEPEGAVKCKSVTGANWANDDALLQALRSNENLYDLSTWGNGRWFEIALIDEEAGQITTQSIGCDEWHETQPETYAILWLDADGNELFAEKLTVRMEHTNPNTVYKAEKVKLLIPAENILPNTTEQAGVSATVADGSVTYVFTSSQPDIHTLVAAPEGAASYSVYEDSRSERYELVDGRYVYYQLSDWTEGTTELTVSDMLIWYDADGNFMDAGEITFTYIHKPIADLPALKLPAFLKQIDAEAFAGSGAQAIILPDGCESIGSRAFADCAQLQVIHIPASVTEIAEDAFDGCENLTVFAPEGSKAAVYALANGFTWFAE